MTAIRELIFAKVQTRLEGIAGIGSVQRMPSGDPSAFPALSIVDDGHSTVDDQTEPGANRYDLSLMIEGFVSGGDGAGAHAASNALYLSVVQAIDTGDKLDGLAEEITEGALRVDVATLANQRCIAFQLEFTIRFPAPRGAPTM